MININKDDEYYKDLKSKQETYIKYNDMQKDLFSAGSTLAVQGEDRGLWMHGVILECKSNDHWGLSYWVWVKKTGGIIM